MPYVSDELKKTQARLMEKLTEVRNYLEKKDIEEVAKEYGISTQSVNQIRKGDYYNAGVMSALIVRALFNKAYYEKIAAADNVEDTAPPADIYFEPELPFPKEVKSGKKQKAASE